MVPQADDTEQVADYIEKDILDFLNKKYVIDATLSVSELMDWYACDTARAKRALQRLAKQGYLRYAGGDSYQVIV